MAQAAALEKGRKHAAAIDTYRDILAQRRLDEKHVADAAERMLALPVRGPESERVVALSRGALERMTDVDLEARIRKALVRHLVRRARMNEAILEAGELGMIGVDNRYERMSQRIIGDELLKMAAELLAEENCGPARTAYKAATVFARHQDQRDDARYGEVETLVAWGKAGEAEALVDGYLAEARDDAARARILILRIRLLLASEDVDDARKVADGIDAIPKASNYNRDWARIYIARHLQARVKDLRAELRGGSAAIEFPDRTKSRLDTQDLTGHLAVLDVVAFGVTPEAG